MTPNITKHATCTRPGAYELVILRARHGPAGSHGEGSIMSKQWGIAVVCAGVLVLAGCSSSSGGTGGYTPSDLSSEIVSGYTYKLTGTAGSVDITMQTDGGSTQKTGESLPFEQEVGELDFLYISAQITDDSGGDVKCEIVASNGDVVATNEASGFPSIVTCDNAE